MSSGAFVERYFLCVSCGPEAKRCTRRNAACGNPKVEMSKEAYDKAARAWLLARRRTKTTERAYVFNYYDYYD